MSRSKWAGFFFFVVLLVALVLFGAHLDTSCRERGGVWLAHDWKCVARLR